MRKIVQNKIKRILVVRNDRLGEFLLSLPVLVNLKKYFYFSKLTLVVNPYLKELAGRIPLVDNVLVWENAARHSIFEKNTFLHSLRERRYDLALILNPSKEFNVFSYFAGIPLRAGYDRKLGFLLNYRIKDKKSDGLRHEVDYNLDLLRRLNVYTMPFEVSFPLRIEENDFPGYRLEEFGISGSGLIVIHPFSSNREKEWPTRKFKELIMKLSLQADGKIIVIGEKGELSRSCEFCRGLPVINLTAQTSLIELAALLRRSRVLICNDSGPMHLAAILGLPVTAIFRACPRSVSATRWGPVGSQHVIIEKEDINNISIDEVFNGIQKILKQ